MSSFLQISGAYYRRDLVASIIPDEGGVWICFTHPIVVDGPNEDDLTQAIYVEAGKDIVKWAASESEKP